MQQLDQVLAQPALVIGHGAVGQAEAQPVQLCHGQAQASQGVGTFPRALLAQALATPPPGVRMAGLAVADRDQQQITLTATHSGQHPGAAEDFVVRVRGDHHQPAAQGD
ncbi:hypothetical protein D3C77_531500 [compost metagenome]